MMRRRAATAIALVLLTMPADACAAGEPGGERKQAVSEQFTQAVAQLDRGTPESAAAAAPAVPEMELDDLIRKVYLAYGGKDALSRSWTHCILLGQHKVPSTADTPEKVSRTRHVRRGSGLRIDIEGDSGWTTTVFDGAAAWQVQGKSVTDLSSDEAKVLALEKDRDPSVLCYFQDPDYTFRLLGPTVHNAIPVFAIEVTHVQETSTVFVDRKNFLVLAISYRSTDPETGEKAEVTTDYSEYRPFGGTLIPFKQTQHIDGKMTMELAVENIDLSGTGEEELLRRPDRQAEVRLEKPISLPFLYSHKAILVKVRLNDGEPVDFLLDTGTTQTVIDRRVAAESLLDKRAAYTAMTPGGAVMAPACEIPKLSLGGVSLAGVQAVILDLSPHGRQLGKPVAGIIGNNVLNKFVVTIDYGKNQLTLQDPSIFKAPPQANIVPFADKKGPVIKATINGKEEVPFLVDTGALFNNLPSSAAKKYLGNQTVRYTEGIGVDGRAVRLGNLQIATVKVGSSVARDVAFTYSIETDDRTKKGKFQGPLQGILGNPFWQNFTLTLDYRMRHVIVQPNALLASRQQLEQLVQLGDRRLNVDHDYRAAEAAYQQALNKVQFLGDPRQQARIWGRLGNLRRAMAKDLNRPEQTRVAFEYFSKAQELARKTEDREIEGRVLADWALLYLDGGQFQEARQALDGGMAYCPQDAQVNVNFAVYLYKMKMYGDMRSYIDKALFLEPSNWQALWYRLKLCEMFNDLGQQKETLKEILKYYPWSKVAGDKYASLLNPQSPPASTTAAPQ